MSLFFDEQSKASKLKYVLNHKFILIAELAKRLLIIARYAK